MRAPHGVAARPEPGEAERLFTSEREVQPAPIGRFHYAQARKLAEVSASDDGTDEQRGPGELQTFTAG
jgi:hypothetical protein